MRLGLMIGLFLLAFTAGCASSQAHDSSIDLSDPQWTPPGQGDLAIGDDPAPKAKPKPKKARHLEQPNLAEKPTQPLHARNP